MQGGAGVLMRHLILVLPGDLFADNFPQFLKLYRFLDSPGDIFAVCLKILLATPPCRNDYHRNRSELRVLSALLQKLEPGQ